MTTGRAARRGRWLLVAIGLALVATLGGLLAVAGLDSGGWLWERLTGRERVPTATAGAAADLSRAAFLAGQKSFAPDPDRPGGVWLPPGEHVIARTVVVPRGLPLRVAPGAVLRFHPGRSLIAFGPVDVRGTAAAPVRFTARFPGLAWGAVVVVGAAPARFEHAHFREARHVRLDGTELPGGLSLLDTHGEVLASQFEAMRGKDAMWVRGGTVSVRDSLFRDAEKDGLDLDGAGGEVRGNRFIDCGDEGIDLSADATAVVVDNVVLDARGGRIGAEGGQAAILAERNTLGYSAPGRDGG